jgi:hypothetical protein
MGGKEGFSGLNQNLNNNSNSVEKSVGLNKENLESLIATGRVLSILLDDKHPKFKDFGGWSALGVIEFINVDTNGNNVDNATRSIAKPLYSNQKLYPILNEIVYLIALPNQGVMENGSSKQYYYFTPINVWNHPHHNAVPFFLETNSSNKSYNVSSLGSTNKTVSKSKSINLGEGFKEYSNLHPLLPYLGDYILEGRWGNSIRLGSTVKGKNNIWSSNGENGDPILIIRNGQPPQSSDEGWIPILEDINKDLSSIYITSKQKIAIKVASESYKSYNQLPTKASEYNESQIIFSSSRLLFNSYKDHILFSSTKSIGLNSKESVNIDTPLFISSAKINRLGDKNTTNPMLKGDETVAAIDKITGALVKLAQSLITLAELLPPVPNVPVNIAANEIIAELTQLKGKLNTPGNLKSKNNFLI